MPRSWEREIDEMLQRIGIVGRSFKRRLWLKMGCNANDDDEFTTDIKFELLNSEDMKIILL